MRGGTHRSVVASALRLAWAALLLMMGLLPGAGLALAQTPETAAGPAPAAPDVTYLTARLDGRRRGRRLRCGQRVHAGEHGGPA